MPAKLRIAIAQLNFFVGDIPGNLAQIKQAIEHAHRELHAHLILFPELALTGYPPEDLLLRPQFHEQIRTALQSLQELGLPITAIVGYPEQSAAGIFNSACVIDAQGVSAVYRKHALPNYSVFDEKRYFMAGSEACVCEIQGVRIGVTICEDIWQPDAAAKARAAGAQLLVNLNASPFHQGKKSERIEVLRARVAENGLPIVYVNLVGGQDELVFDGSSLVMSAQGEVSHCLPSFKQQITPIDFGLDSALVALDPLPMPAHDPLADIYAAIVLGVRDYVYKNGFKGAVLGLSGGIDSALTLAIAVDALSPTQVEAVMMPSRYTSEMSLQDARSQAQTMHVAYSILPIEGPFQSFQETLKDSFADYAPDVTEENLQARCRGVLLMAISNKKGKILLTTGNKSEMAVGYATLYGDMAGGYAPIKDVPKTLVYALARYRNQIAPVIPQRVIDRPPSAELAPDQVDADSLPAYDILDPILERLVEREHSIESIIKDGYAPDIVQRVAKLVRINEYKRRQAPPGVRISQRAFGRDRRYPITCGYRE